LNQIKINQLYNFIIVGLGEAIYSPAFDALYSKYLDGDESGIEWGAWESLDYFTRAIGALAGGLLVKCCGFSAMFIAMGLLCSFSAVYIYALPRKAL